MCTSMIARSNPAVSIACKAEPFRSFAPHHGGKFSLKDFSQKIADARIVLSHQYSGHVPSPYSPDWMGASTVYRSDQAPSSQELPRPLFAG